jgi:hypothetical protein
MGDKEETVEQIRNQFIFHVPGLKPPPLGGQL